MWLDLMIQTYNSTFFMEIELGGAMFSIKYLFAASHLLAPMLGNLCIFND